MIDLDNKLRALGSSLDAQRTVFIERYLAMGWLQQQVKDEQEVDARANARVLHEARQPNGKRRPACAGNS